MNELLHLDAIIRIALKPKRLAMVTKVKDATRKTEKRWMKENFPQTKRKIANAVRITAQIFAS